MYTFRVTECGQARAWTTQAIENQHPRISKSRLLISFLLSYPALNHGCRALTDYGR
jgi:hypothetical protein